MMGLSVAASFALPGIGGVLVSCVLDGTFTDMLTAITTGDWALLAMSVAGVALAGIGLGIAKMGRAAGEVGTGVAKAARGVSSEASDVGKTFTKSGFRKGLVELTGHNPGRAAEAHHVLPQKFEKLFKASGIDSIHNPKYGSWWETASHRENAYAYNLEWENFLGGTARDPNDILSFARGLGGKYGFEIHF